MPEAEYILGLFYAENMVVSIDYDKALYWVRKAAASGSHAAKEALPDLERAAVRYAERRTTGPDTLHQVPVVPIALTDTSTAPQGGAILQSAMLGADRTCVALLVWQSCLTASFSWTLWGCARFARRLMLAVLKLLHFWGGMPKRVWEGPVTMSTPLLHTSAPQEWGLPRAGAPPCAPEKAGHSSGSEEPCPARRSRSHVHLERTPCIGIRGDAFEAQALLTPSQTVQLLKKAAEREYVPALIELGLWYFAGRWVNADAAHAWELWERAASLGSREAELRIVAVRLREETDSAAVARDLAAVRLGMEDGSVLAEVTLGYCYETGRGVQPRVAEAVRLYRVAARRGSLDAYRALRRLHDDRRPADPDFVIREEE